MTITPPEPDAGGPPAESGSGGPRSFAASRAHQARAHALIPGGCHTYARGDDQMPEGMPVVLTHGRGCRVRDVDGNAFVEYGMGLRAVTLGHAEPRVVEAARRTLDLGSGFSRPHAIELEAAERFLALVPTAEMVKFCKDGSSAVTSALTLARAATGRRLVAYCADHPFFSQHGWFIGTTPMDAGLLLGEAAALRPFRHGDLASLEAVFAAHPSEIAAVLLEPARGDEDAGPFLRAARALCDREGAALVFDEMITGFRWHAGGAQALYGVTPDLSAFGKALANGFSVSALAGRRALMELGGLRTAAPRVFLLSSTHGAETHALAAALATMRIYAEEDVVGQLHARGRAVRAAVDAAIADAGVAGFVEVLGRDCNLVVATRDAEGRPSQAFRTLLLQELTRRGVLAPSLVVSVAHDDAAVAETAAAFAGALAVYRRAVDEGVERHLDGRPVQPALRRYA